ncbi:coiled-coil domain-containing protein mad1 [Paramarasmius palmivorus]|uniref:Spindle assembly checkpoint component MAD1 n=1 Tax=Paramarasmius palmivorus TaxID=297713 RepID=A0AAW0BU44_9AGAR
MAGPSSSSSRPPPTTNTTRSLRSSVKRDLSTAQLSDSTTPGSSSKRALLSSTLTHASLERQLASYKTTNIDLEAKIRERDAQIAELTRDRRFLADREAAERTSREELEADIREKEGRYLTELSGLKTKYGTAQGEVMDLRDDIDKLKRKYERKVGERDIEIAALRNSLEASKKEFVEWKERAERLKEVEVEKKVMDDYVKVVKEEYEKALAEMEEERDEAIEKKEEVEEELTAKNSEIQSLKETIEEQAEQWKALEAHAESLEEALRAQPPPQPTTEPESATPSAMSLTTTFPPGATSASPAAKSKAARESISSRLLSTPTSSPSRPRKPRQSLGMSTPLREVHTQPWDSFRESHIQHSASPKRESPSAEELKEKEERAKKDRETLGPHLASLTEHVRKLESENVRLRADVGVLRGRDQSIQVLNEEKASLQSRLARQEAEVNRLLREIETMKSTSSTSASSPSIRRRVSSPMAVDEPTPSVEETAALAALRLEHAKLLESYGLLKAELAALRSSTSSADSLSSSSIHLETSSSSLNTSGATLVPPSSPSKEDTAELRLRLKDRQLADALREIGYLKAWVESYTLEMQLSTPNAGSGSGTADAGGVEIGKMDRLRVKQLEELLSTARTENEDLRKEIERLLSSADAPLSAAQSELSKAKTELDATQSQVTALEAQVENLEQTLFDLRGEIAGGRHVPPNTRILAMKENPLRELIEVGREAVERLRVENEGLLKRLSELESSSGSRGSDRASTTEDIDLDAKDWKERLPELVPKATVLTVIQQKEIADDERDQAKKRLLRLQQVFKAKSDEFKEAIGSLLGVKVAFYPNGQVRITSVYDLNASFVFSPSKDSSQTTRMQLVGYSAEAPEDSISGQEYWIGVEGCIPGFIASVTLECYERWKRGGGRELPDLGS